MGFTIEELRRPPSGAMYVSPARICVTADDEICDENDTRAVRLLVAEGGEIPATEAAKYGMIVGSEAATAARGTAAGEGGDGDDDLGILTSRELRERAEALGIEIDSRARKAEIIAAIEEAATVSGAAEQGDPAQQG